jgi:hypothetical protein
MSSITTPPPDAPARSASRPARLPPAVVRGTQPHARADPGPPAAAARTPAPVHRVDLVVASPKHTEATALLRKPKN